MRLRVFFIQIIFLLFFIQLVQAQTKVEKLAKLSLEELMQVKVSSTGFFAMPVERSPGFIKIVSNKEINNLPVNSLSDIFDFYLPGVHLSNTFYEGVLYSVRGMTIPQNSTTLFMINGYNFNRATGNGINSGLMLPLLGDIDQIEVINGPCSIVHGSGSINGFVNIIPKNGSNYPDSFYEITYGFKDKLYKFETGYGYSYGLNKDIFIYNGFVKSNGFKPEYNFGYVSNSGYDPDVYDKKVRGFPEPSLKWSLIWNHNDFSFKLLFNREKYYINTLNTGSFFDDMSDHASMAVIPEYNYIINDYEDIKFSIPVMFFDNGIENYNISNSTTTKYGGSENHIESKIILRTTRFNNNSIALGGFVGFRNFKDDEFIFLNNLNNKNTYLDTYWNESGLFFENIIELMPELSFSFGMRYDRIDYKKIKIPVFDPQSNAIKEKIIVPGSRNISTSRFALFYTLDELNNFKFSFQEGFHHPELSNLYFLGFLSNELKAEKIESFELNYQHKPDKYGLSFDINLYYNIFKDSILVETKTNNAFLNRDPFSNSQDDFSSTGGEFSIEFKSNEDSIYFTYGYSIPVNLSENDNIKISIANNDCSKWSGYPTHIIKSNIVKNFFNNRLTMVLNFLYNSPFDVETSSSSNIYDHNRIITNIMAKYTFTNFYIKAFGKNIFSCDVPPVSYINDFPWMGNLGTDESYFYIGIGWEK